MKSQDLAAPVKERFAAAVLFSGGDAPGMNAFLRAVVRLGLHRHGADMFGVRDGYAGLVCFARHNEHGLTEQRSGLAETPRHFHHSGDAAQSTMVRLDDLSVTHLIDRGGIVLGSARCAEFHQADVRASVIRALHESGIGGLVVVGGEGSLKGAAALSAEGNLPVVGVPATIDNDVAHSEMALGFDTAVNTVVECVRKFDDTAASHHRVMVLETMGRDSGQIAQYAALASGAAIVVTPERGRLRAVKLQGIADRLAASMASGQRHAILLVAEGVEVEDGQGTAAASLAAYLARRFTGDGAHHQIEVRQSVLGHLQRGGPPTAADCILAARFAEVAWGALVDRTSGVTAVVRGEVKLVPFEVVTANHAGGRAARDYKLQKDVSKYQIVGPPGV